MNTNAGSSPEFPSSMDTVLSNDDLLIEILLRLPFLSLNLFKSVSKRWLTLITDPTFTLRQTRNPSRDPPSGLFLQRRYSVKYDFLTLDARIPVKKCPLRINLGSGEVEILQSCNGLLLCKIIGIGKFYVYNLHTSQFTMVPQFSFSNWDWYLNWIWNWSMPVCGLRMAFDPSKSPHYKVIYARTIDNDPVSLVQMQTYSSETCGWSVCDNLFPHEIFRGFIHGTYRQDDNYFKDFKHGFCWNDALYRGFSNGIYWNGAIHWLDGVKRDLHHKLDVENPNLTSIRTPLTSNGTMHWYQRLFESPDCLLLLCTPDTQSMQVNIYEMRKWCSGWLIKHIVNIDDIMMHLPDIWTKPPYWFCSTIRCIVVGNNEEDSFIVMKLYGNIVQYKIASKTICKLYEFESIHSGVSFQFIASSASV